MSYYTVRYKTRIGGSGMLTTSDIEKVHSKLKTQWRAKLTATAYEDKEEIGRVWEMDNGKWTYSLLI